MNIPHMTSKVASLIEELRKVFYLPEMHHPGESPACHPIEDKIFKELDKLSDADLKEFVEALDGDLSDMLFSVIIELYDSGRGFLKEWDEHGGSKTPEVSSMNRQESIVVRLKGIKLISNCICYGPCPEPDDEVEQHLSILKDGRVYFSRYAFGKGFEKHSLIERRNFKIDSDAAAYILKRIEDYYATNDDVIEATDVGTWELTITHEDGSKEQDRGSLIPMGGGLQSISDTIRYYLNMPDLLCFDGRANEDRIENIKIKYNRTTKIKPKVIPEGATWEYVTWNYSETIELDRKTETVIHIQNIAQECSVKREYHVSEGVSNFLDDLDADELFTSVQGNPPDIEKNPLEEKSYSIIVTYLHGEKRIISGSFDKYGLPEDYPDFAEDLFEFMRFYGFGELLDPSVFGKALRQKGDLIFCNVCFEDYGKTYCYLTEDESIEPGDMVVVPVGSDNHESVATVESVEYHSIEDAPFPIEKIKTVFRKADYEEPRFED